MRSLRLVVLAVAVAFVSGALAASVVAAPKVPAPFAFEQGKGSPGPVTFNHELHRDKLGKCTACHTKIFKMKKGKTGTLTMAKMKAGQECGACHNGKTKVGDTVVFTVDDKANCEKCHKKKM